MILSLFGKKPPVDRAASERIRTWIADVWAEDVRAEDARGGDAETRFSINEIICRDPSCPGTETVILVMAPGAKTRAIKIAAAMADVTEQGVRDAVAEAIKTGA